MTAVDVRQIVAEEVGEIRALLPITEYVGLSFIAARMGCTAQHLRDHKELQPNHGVSDKHGRLEWLRSTVRAWVEVSIRQHAEDWERLPPSVKAEITRRRG